jgi:hypothetical protein
MFAFMFGHFLLLVFYTPSHKCSFFLFSCGYFSYGLFVVDRSNGLGQKDVHNLDVGQVTRFVSQLETNVEINNLKSDRQVDDDPGLIKAHTTMPPTHVPEQSAQRKRQRPPEENTETFAERKPKKAKVKDEHLKKEEVNEAAEEANDEIDNDALCVMCSEQPRTVMLLPCHCFNFCKDCVSESTHCFTCRVPIERKMEAY